MNPILTAIDEIASWEGPNMRWLREVGDFLAKREADCPGHVASELDAKVCLHCGIRINALRPDDEECDGGHHD